MIYEAVYQTFERLYSTNSSAVMSVGISLLYV